MTNTTPAFDPRTATDEQILRHDAKRQIENIAARMESTAGRIRDMADALDQPRAGNRRTAAGIAADVTQEYLQMSGNIGPSFWGLIHELSRMDTQ